MNEGNNIGLGSLESQLSVFEKLTKNGLESLNNLKSILNKPEYNKPRKTFNKSEIERITGVARSSLRDNEKTNKIAYDSDSPALHADNKRKEYTIKDLNAIRDFFGKGFFNGQIERPANLKTISIAFSMFKGGVGKTTQAAHLAAHCAIAGLKVLLVDLDPQATATFAYGYVPTIDIHEGTTIYGALIEDKNLIKDIIKPTHYDNLDIITSGLELQGADIALPSPNLNNQEEMGPPLLRIFNTIEVIKNQYDVIIFDCAPNHAATTMNALTAADGIILPVMPSMYSYSSAIQFCETLSELTDVLINNRNNPDSQVTKRFLDAKQNKIFKILLTNDPAHSEANDATAAIRALFGNYVLPRPMCRTIALDRTSNDMSLLYDLKRQDVRGSKESFDRGLAGMKAVNDDILTLLKSVWRI